MEITEELSELKKELKQTKRLRRSLKPFWNSYRVETLIYALPYFVVLSIIYIAFVKTDHLFNSNKIGAAIGTFFLSCYFSLFIWGFFISIFEESMKSIIKKLKLTDSPEYDNLKLKQKRLESQIKNLEDKKLDLNTYSYLKKDTYKNDSLNLNRETNKKIITINSTSKVISQTNEEKKIIQSESRNIPVKKNTLTTSESIANDIIVNKAEEIFSKEIIPELQNPSHIEQLQKKSSEEYIEIIRSNQGIGIAGEYFVFKYEKDRLRAIGKNDLAIKVKHASKEIGDGLGYDIISYDKNDELKYIEVKSTVSNFATDFYMSQNEFIKLRQMNNFCIYRVYDFNIKTNQGKIFIIDDLRKLESYFRILPFNYRIIPNKSI